MLNEIPEWIDQKHSYKAQYNQAPTNYLPILLSKKHVDPSCDVNQRVLMAMRWGLIPSYFNDDPKNFKLSTINCRSEQINKSKIFKSCLEKGRRCVLVVEGYYEWKKDSKHKVPYFFFFPQSNVSFTTRDWMLDESKIISEAGWTGPTFLTIAGFFDICKRKDYEPLYSFTICTVEAHSKLRWCHTRMPAILSTDTEVQKWLDFVNVKSDEALKLLQPYGNLEYHQVDSFVNSTTNQGVKCVLPIKEVPSTSPTKGQPKISEFFIRSIEEDLKKDEKE